MKNFLKRNIFAILILIVFGVNFIPPYLEKRKQVKQNTINNKEIDAGVYIAVEFIKEAEKLELKPYNAMAHESSAICYGNTMSDYIGKFGNIKATKSKCNLLALEKVIEYKEKLLPFLENINDRYVIAGILSLVYNLKNNDIAFKKTKLFQKLNDFSVFLSIPKATNQYTVEFMERFTKAQNEIIKEWLDINKTQGTVFTKGLLNRRQAELESLFCNAKAIKSHDVFLKCKNEVRLQYTYIFLENYG
jgi:GH24 family phage-related lysozyme (muramidase)